MVKTIAVCPNCKNDAEDFMIDYPIGNDNFVKCSACGFVAREDEIDYNVWCKQCNDFVEYLMQQDIQDSNLVCWKCGKRLKKL